MKVKYSPRNAILHNPLICLMLVYFLVFTACSDNNMRKQASNKEKYDEFLASLEGNNVASNVSISKRDLSSFAGIDLYAVVRKDNVCVYSRPDPNSEIIGYLYGGGVVNFTLKTRNSIKTEDGLEYFYLFCEHDIGIFFENSRKEFTGWVFGTNVKILKIEETNDDGKHYRKFPTEKDSSLVVIEDYYDYLDDEQKSILEKINQIYTFQIPVILSQTPMNYKLEIRAKSNEVHYSTYITCSEMPFMIQPIREGNYFLRYSTELPVYLAIYGTHIPSLERTPVCVFLITPNDGAWEGILSLGCEFKRGLEYRIYLYTFDPANPADYTRMQLIDGYWNNIINF